MSDENSTEGLESLLEQRGVTSVDAFVHGLGEHDFFNLDACLAAVERYDREGSDHPGLLVYRIREAAKSKWRPKGRQAVTAGTASPELLQSIRGSCRSPNGFCRGEARSMLAEKARGLRLDPDRLIDMAMGADWQETPVHPALVKDGTPAERLRRYERWLSEGMVAL